MPNGKLELTAACCTHVGRVRKNNEDNLFFAGRILEKEHGNLEPPITKKGSLDGDPVCFSVFDGMGGESAGEAASFIAAETMKNELACSGDYLVNGRTLLEELYEKINIRVCEASERLAHGRMGSTGVSLMFMADEVYLCSLGDSKAYRFRDNTLMQLSVDHLEMLPDWEKRKPRLTQHFGVFPDELTLEPSISKGELRKGDIYLLCSDGLTDMVSNVEICAILKEPALSLAWTVKKLLKKALAAGGKDNITIICCKIC